MVKNFYPSFPELPYKQTSIEMPLVVVFARQLVGKYNKEVVRAAYCVFRNESSNGKAGVNNNYIGLQCDNAIWQGLNNYNITGTCIKRDGNNQVRRFLCFNSMGYENCFEFLCFKLNQRGVFIGAKGVTDSDTLYDSYEAKWVSNPSENTKAARENFVSLYHSSLTAIV